jgi:hypothetical protein
LQAIAAVVGLPEDQERQIQEDGQDHTQDHAHHYPEQAPRPYTPQNGKNRVSFVFLYILKDAYRSLKNPMTLLQKRAATPMEISPSTNSAIIAIKTTVDQSI